MLLLSILSEWMLFRYAGRRPWVDLMGSLSKSFGLSGKTVDDSIKETEGGQQPIYGFYKLTSVIFLSPPSSCPHCPLVAISVRRPFNGFVPLNQFSLQGILLQHPPLHWLTNSCLSFKTQVKCHFSLKPFYSFILQTFIKQGTVLHIRARAASKTDEAPAFTVLTF